MTSDFNKYSPWISSLMGDGPQSFTEPNAIVIRDILYSLPVPFTPMPLNRSREPFSSADWVFELKYDGFRALAEIEYGRCRLISRNRNTFATFQDLALSIGRLFPQDRVVLDGEIACLDETGCPSAVHRPAIPPW